MYQGLDDDIFRFSYKLYLEEEDDEDEIDLIVACILPHLEAEKTTTCIFSSNFLSKANGVEHVIRSILYIA